MTYRRLKGILIESNKCRLHNKDTPYEVWYSTITKKYFSFECWDDNRNCDEDDIKRILKQAGIERRWRYAKV